MFFFIFEYFYLSKFPFEFFEIFFKLSYVAPWGRAKFKT